MAKVGAQKAAALTGKSKSTIQRAMNDGKLSYDLDTNGYRVVDVSELERVYGLKQRQPAARPQNEDLQKASTLIEMERLKMRVKMLEEQLDMAKSQIDDLKEQRDQWQKQASQVLITSQYSQKQAEELRAQIKERERRVRERRKQMLAKKAQNMNKKNKSRRPANAQGAGYTFSFSDFWKRGKAG
jgi:chromosome segregation ATPase